METAQELKLNMQLAVEKCCDDNPKIVSSVPAFSNSTVLFKSKVAAINACVGQEKLAISGITTDKALAKKALCRFAADTAAPICAFATVTNNTVLKKLVSHTYSSLYSIKDDALVPVIQNIHNAGKANLPALKAYGITAPILEILQTVLNNFKVKQPNPKDATSIKKAIRLNLKVLLKEADLILKEQMDRTLPALVCTYPDFVAAFKASRVIIDHSKLFAKLKGQIRSSEDGSIIHGAVVSLDNTLFAAISNSKGQYTIREVPFGVYTVIVTAPNYCDTSQSNVTLKLGQICVLDMELSPVEVLKKAELSIV